MSAERTFEDSLRIAVVTRTRDRPSLLVRARESVVSQDHPVVWSVVNDGGAPAPVEAEVDAARRAGVSCRLVHHDTSRGRATAANVGIREAAAETDAFLILDDDDSLFPGAIAALASALAARPAAAGMLGQVMKIRERRTSAGVWRPGESFIANPERGPVRLADLAYRNIVPLNGLLLRHRAFEEAGGFNEELPVLEDWDLLLRVTSKHDIDRLDDVVAAYYLRAASGDPDDPLGNSVTAGRALHEEWEVRLRNRYLREDLAAGRYGLGHLMNPPHRLPMERINLVVDTVNRTTAHLPFIGRLRRRLARP